MNANDRNRLSLSPGSRRRGIVAAAIWLVLGAAAGMALDRSFLLASVPSGSFSSLALITEAWNTIERHYVDRAALDSSKLTYGAIGGMVDALGDTGHSVFLPPEMVGQLALAEHGEFKGIGVKIEMKNGHVVIVAPIDGSPAQSAGLRSGDIILRVNGQDIAHLPLHDVVQRVLGPAGTRVGLSVLDPRTNRIRELSLVRAEIKLRNVTWQQLPGTAIADVRIAEFSDGVTGELTKALREIDAQRLQGLILDLRDNPGGILDQAVGVASQFLTQGNVVLVKDADGNVTPVPVRSGGVSSRLPMVVLINAGSASSSEIVAGALRDAQRATLIGETTFGTGTVLNEFPLSDGSALLLAVDEWLTPSGHSFWHQGLAPQIQVALPPDVNPLMPPLASGMTAHALRASRDAQLLRAVDWLAQKAAHQGFPANGIPQSAE